MKNTAAQSAAVFFMVESGNTALLPDPVLCLTARPFLESCPAIGDN